MHHMLLHLSCQKNPLDDQNLADLMIFLRLQGHLFLKMKNQLQATNDQDQDDPLLPISPSEAAADNVEGGGADEQWPGDENLSMSILKQMQPLFD